MKLKINEELLLIVANRCRIVQLFILFYLFSY